MTVYGTPVKFARSRASRDALVSLSIVAVQALTTAGSASASHWPGFAQKTWTTWMNDSASADIAPSWSQARTTNPGCAKGPRASSSRPRISPKLVGLCGGVRCDASDWHYHRRTPIDRHHVTEPRHSRRNFSPDWFGQCRLPRELWRGHH